MAVYREDTGARLSKSALTALLNQDPTPDPTYTVPPGVRLVKDAAFEPGAKTPAPFPGDATTLVAGEGDQISTAQIDQLYPTATVDSVSPATGAAAGNQVVQVYGTNFTPGSTVTFGGTAATAVTVKSATQIQCTTPAKAAGAYTVAVTTDTGVASKANAYTYS